MLLQWTEVPAVSTSLGVVSLNPPPVAVAAYHSLHRDKSRVLRVIEDDDVPWTTVRGAPGNPPLAIAQGWRHGLASDADPQQRPTGHGGHLDPMNGGQATGCRNSETGLG